MNKFKSNPLKSFKKVLNDTSSKIVTTYDSVSTQVASGIAETMPKLTQDLQVIANNVTGTEMIKIVPSTIPVPASVPTQMKLNALAENEKMLMSLKNDSNNYSAFENKIKPLYRGCYPDDPLNPSMPEYLGTVSNSAECIRLGKMNNLKYVGVQQGDKCFGSNFIPTIEPVGDNNKNLYCNVPCSNPNSGTCGGYYYNQIFSTETTNQFPELNKIIWGENNLNLLPNDVINSETDKKNVSNIVEKFSELNSDINKINLLLNKSTKQQFNPINPFILFVWIIVLLLLICVLIDYLYSRKSTK